MERFELKKHLIPVMDNQEIVNAADEQWKIFWMWSEPKVEKDIQDILVNFKEADKHAVLTTLKLFSLYETQAGSEYWSGRFRRIFDGADFHRMAAVFAAFELAVHSPFYNRINELLHVNTPEFYLSFNDTEVLRERMRHIAAIIDDEDDLVSLAGFAFVEGVILYSSFAFLKHYQNQGKNQIVNVGRGLDFSLRDENLHAKASAWCFKYKKAKENLSEYQEAKLKSKIEHIAQTLLEHEEEIIKMMFSKGKIEGITDHQLTCFVKSRINLMLQDLGYPSLYKVDYNPIKDWFYKAINDYSFNDFFSGLGNEYHRDWDEQGFVWKDKGA